ncbi:phytanoyl-CoA dioxygenase family protein [Actinoplanes oblitus]|uniref:Phytanoyl-CoA dioxygenase family protein n=1 Tax=Actinoplanes oblitus TaxID=3040509 RepID=A0ABY8W7K7_9ACTN|nr:phytanoyl-CoA dioxygenase family protein [Actinoplanes oblitus]WIM93121.1 phytanoyl-CoA dioxygenase family protein [Actinoplanes oblitus]
MREVGPDTDVVRDGYVLADPLDTAVRTDLTAALDRLLAKGERILRTAADEGTSLETYYRTHGPELICVPEAGSATSVCRIEYLAGADQTFRALVDRHLLPAVEAATGEPYVLFKDKCNLKYPGGGAFTPHQDFPAYEAFGPAYHVTAMVALDRADQENGCLQVATNHRRVAREHGSVVEREVAGRPLFRAVQEGDAADGSIVPEAVRVFDWHPLEVAAGDIVLFDSFIPHRSFENRSSRARRALFMTFNRRSDGDHYEEYYTRKRAAYADPAFHVATPTNRGHTPT